MSAENKELTNEEIKEAIEKKHCPYCKGQKFVGTFRAYQEFEFSEVDTGRRPMYLKPDLSDSRGTMNTHDREFREIWCDTCTKTIPAEIWSEWKL